MKKTSIVRNGERYFGVDIDAGGIVIAERMDGRTRGAARYPAGPEGIEAVRSHIARQTSHPHVCICGAAALTLAVALMNVDGVEVTLVSAKAVKESPARGAARAPCRAPVLIAIVHRCPTCVRMHEVTRARAEMAHPAQLCCSPECEAETRRRSGARALRSLHARTEAAAFIAARAPYRKPS